MRSTWEGILASIFHRFWWVLGAKLGRKIEPRSKKKCIENMVQNKNPFERVLERFWADFGAMLAPNIISGGLCAPLLFALKI